MPVTTRRRRLPTVLVVVGVLVLGVGAVGVLAWCSTLGCTLFREPFEPRGAQATAARADARAGVDETASVLARGHPVLAATTLDECLAGQNSWKVKDTYAHECVVHDSRVLAVATPDDEVGPALTAFDAGLRGLGCAASPSGGLDAVRARYWSPVNPNVAREGAAGLPRAGYDCPGAPGWRAAPRGPVRRTPTPLSRSGPGLAGSEVLGGARYDGAGLASVRRSGASLALVVTVSRPYYRTRF